MLRLFKNKGLSEFIDLDIDFKVDTGEGSAGTVEGYGSVFNLLDRGGDIILPGAFKKSLAEWRKSKNAVPMLWQHDASEPIGIWNELKEDDKGLRVKGELVLDVPKAQAAYSLMKKKAVKGLSIGYRTKQSEIDRTTGVRKLKEVELWEISLVTFPMMPEAQITGVKNEFDAHLWEKTFRDGGLSNREAKLATSIARKLSRRDDADQTGIPNRDGLRDVLLKLRKLNETLR